MGRRALPAGRWFALLLAAGVTAGCAAPSPVVTGDDADPGPLLAGTPLTGLVGRVMVLEDASHGPWMCLGMMTASDPPQCGEVDVEGWNWAAVPRDGYTEKGATRYGDFELSGSLRTFDGSFVLDAPPVPVDRTTGGSLSLSEDDLVTPYPEPAGGWRPPDPERATDSALSDVALLGEQDPEVGAVRIDQRLPPEVWDGPPEELERVANDPMRLVLNVSSTGDLTALEARVRQL
ncbi:hypothetical protein ACFFKU_17060 [Kineococcus gynurae]|uniref:Uncharacterized protein n=1 Tax=Kineococcus gynurae TaxID=452979 RepID=A0ABV5LP08_9ACTN